MGLIPRTTDNSGSGGTLSGSSTTDGGDHTSKTARIVLPIVLILVILILSFLFGLYCRRVLHRSRIGPIRLDVFGGPSRPRMYDVRLERPADRPLSLSDMQPLSLQRGSPSPIPAPSIAPSSKLSSPRVDLAQPESATPHVIHPGVGPDDLQTVVHIAMPRPARSRQSSQDREHVHDLPEGLTFGILRHS